MAEGEDRTGQLRPRDRIKFTAIRVETPTPGGPDRTIFHQDKKPTYFSQNDEGSQFSWDAKGWSGKITVEHPTSEDIQTGARRPAAGGEGNQPPPPDAQAEAHANRAAERETKKRLRAEAQRRAAEDAYSGGPVGGEKGPYDS